MKTFIAALVLCAATLATVSAQNHLYDPKADAQQQINTAVAQARKEHKNIFLQVGGNWCIWCTRFHNFVQSNDTLKGLLDKNYIALHINYSPENKNEQLLASLGFPQRFGFPVFVVLDENGQRIHTQNSSYLEQDKGYDAKKVAGFLEQWSPAALDEKTYKK